LHFIERTKPDQTFVIAAWNNYGDQTTRDFLTDVGDEEATAVSNHRVITEGIPKTLVALSKVSPVIAFRSWPILPRLPNLRSVTLLGLSRTEVTVAKDDFLLDNHTINQTFDAIGDPGILFFDPAKKVCMDAFCHSEVGRTKFYEDTYHISPQGALRFAAEINELLHVGR